MSSKLFCNLGRVRQARLKQRLRQLIRSELKQAIRARALGRATPTGPAVGAGDGARPPKFTVAEKTRLAIHPLVGRIFGRIKLASDRPEPARIAGAARSNHELFMRDLRTDPASASLQPAVPYQYRPPSAAPH